MSVNAYVRRILARWRLITLVTAALTLVALVITLTADTVYTSHAQLYVASAGDDSDLEAIIADGVQVKGRALSYAAVADSEQMALRVRDELGLDESAEDISARIDTTVPFATVFIDLAATGDSPEQARDLAAAVVDNYNDVLADIETADVGGLQVKVSTLREATLPERATSPRPLLNLLAGLVAGLLLGVALAVLRDLLDQRVRTADDIRGLGLVPLGALTPDGGIEAVRDAVLAATAASAHRAVVVTPLHDGLDDVAATLTQAFAAADYRAQVVTPDPGPDGEQKVATLREQHDVLVVGAPHGMLLAAATDGAVLVVEPGRVDRDDIAETARKFADAGARVLGVLLVEPRTH